MTANKGKKQMTPQAIEANRANAQKSTGPKTDEGKSKVRFNAGKHYAYACDPLLPGDSAEDYDRYKNSIAEALEFRNALEFTFIDALVAELWGWQKLISYERNIYNFTPDQGFLLDELTKLTLLKQRKMGLIRSILKEIRQTRDRINSGMALSELMALASETYNALSIPEDPEATIYTEIQIEETTTVVPQHQGRLRKKGSSGGYDKYLDILLSLIQKPNARIIDIIADRFRSHPREVQAQQSDTLQSLFDASPNAPQ